MNDVRSSRPFDADIYYQTTEFTCGPACLVMAMAALDKDYKPSRLEEMKIWRAANLVYMGEAHAGCGPYGLALAAMRRGFATEIYEHNAQNLFKIWTGNKEEATVQTLLDDHDRQQSQEKGCTITQEPLTKELIARLVAEEKQLITLTSKDLEAHWVLVHDLQDGNVFIIDPYKAEGKDLESIYHTDTGRNFIHYSKFEDWVRYGPANGTVLLALSKP